MPPSPPGVDGVHHLRAAGDARQRETAGDGFGEGGDIRRDAHLLHGEQGTGAARAALDLIGDEHNAVLVAQGAQALHKGRGGGIEPAFTLHRLNNDGGDIFRRGIVF